MPSGEESDNSSLDEVLSQIGHAASDLDAASELRRSRLDRRDTLIVRAKALGATWNQLEDAAALSVGGLRKVLQRKGVL